MPIIKKKEPVEEIFFNELEDIISYNMNRWSTASLRSESGCAQSRMMTWKKRPEERS